jgi:hypothetical protein
MDPSRQPSRKAFWRAWMLAALAAGMVAAGAWWLQGGQPPHAATASPAVARPVQTPAASAAQTASSIEPSTAPFTSSGAAAPQGLSAEQLQQLRASLAQHPQREAEVARVSAYLLYSAQWQNFLDRRAAGAAAEELLPLARTLDTGLEQRVLQREVSAGEALLMKNALLEVLAPDTAARQAALRDWRERSSAAVPNAPDPQTAEFERRQAEIVSQWRALPPNQRDAQRLEADLEALRQSSFATPPTTPTQGDGR